MKQTKLLVILFTLLSISLLHAQDTFVRSHIIEVPEIENAGFGEIVSGVDLDGDGLVEIYAINAMWDFFGQDDIPSLYKYEFDGTDWTLVWSTTLSDMKHNSWAALTYGDLDNDGKYEIIWGPVENTGHDPNPNRILVYEVAGDGSDVLGVDDGSGTYLPNAAWTILDFDSNLRPFRWFINDIDEDDVDEVIFSDRRVIGAGFHIGVLSVNDVPDNGDGSEEWTLEFSGLDVPPDFVRASSIEPGIENTGLSDIISGVDLDADGKMEIYAVNNMLDYGGNEEVPRIYKYEWTGSSWAIEWTAELTGMKQNSWPAVTIGDMDSDGKEEIIWGPVENTGNDPNPSRIVVFENNGDGTLGIADGENWLPNSTFTLTDLDNDSQRPFRWHTGDFDDDGQNELVLGSRKGSLRYAVLSVSDIPDAGDGSETWTIEASSDGGSEVSSSTIYDLGKIDNDFYLIHSNGDVTPLKYESNQNLDETGAWVTKPIQVGLLSGGSWKGASEVDIDGDGNNEIITATFGSSLVYLLQEDGDTLKATQIADFSSLGAGRLYGGDAGHIDGDGKLDYVMGSRFGFTDSHAAIFKLSYIGGDISDSSSYSTSILDSNGTPLNVQFDIIEISDIDGDGIDEVAYTGFLRDTGNGQDSPPITIVDYQDGSLVGGNKYDLAIIGHHVYLMDLGTDIQPVKFENGKWQVLPAITVFPGSGSFKSSVVVDIDGDGYEEIVTGTRNGSGAVLLMEPVNGGNGLKVTEIANVSEFGANIMNGADAGDIDGDGFMDFVFGSRGTTPKGQIYRVEHRGGAIDDPANYSAELIDAEISDIVDQYDVVRIANLDDDDDLEVIYTSGVPRGASSGDPMVPLVILDLQSVETTPIADVKDDDFGDFIPDHLGEVFTVVGVVTTPDYGGGFLSIYIQDETAGINIFSPSDPDVIPEVGQLLQVTGTVQQDRGLTELVLDDPNADMVVLGTGTVPEPILFDTLLSPEGAEALEGSLIITAPFIKAEGSADWPSEGSSANMTMTAGFDTTNFAMRIDSDTEIDGQPEPIYPAIAVGVLTQFTFDEPANTGYQIQPRYYSDFEQDVSAPPNSYFFFTQDVIDMYADQTIAVNNNEDMFDFVWNHAVDLNGDDLIYQQVMVVDGVESFIDAGNDTMLTLTGADLVSLVAGAASNTVTITLRTTDLVNPIVYSMFEMWTDFDILVSIAEELLIPKEFFVNQNYPNPFNPSTTIRFGLPKEATVDLRVYDILGRQVTVLIDQEIKSAGTYNYQFNANKLASGTYIYRLQANDKIDIKKMLLLK